MKFTVKIFLLLLAVLISAGNVRAATLYVDDDAACQGTGTVAEPYCKIQDAIDAASDGDVVLVDDGTYRELLTFDGSKKITVRSVNGADNTTINGDINNDGAGDGSVVSFSGGDTSTMDGFTITGGIAFNGGGIHCNSSSPKIINCSINNNSADIHGGGIYCTSSSPEIIDCLIKNNSADRNGGGVYVSFTSVPIINNCEISFNSAADSGAGFYGWGTAHPKITDCKIKNNAGYGIYLYDNRATWIVDNSIISNNASGGIYCHRSEISITDSTISNNSTSGGGNGVHLTIYSWADITNCTISNNGGWGIYSWHDSYGVKITKCKINGNSGGIISGYNVSATIINSIISNNSGSGIGTYMRNNTFVGNCTITGNSTGVGCSGYDSSVTINNSILWGNADGNNFNNGFVTRPSLITYTNIGEVSPSNPYQPYPGIGNINSDPLFVNPADGDYHLSSGSPSIDKGTNDKITYPNIPGDDIENNSRPQGAGHDMGAYEYPGFPCVDTDNDGYYLQEGCGTEIDSDDTREWINPGMDEICENGVDEDSDGKTDEEGCLNRRIIVPDNYGTIQQAIDNALEGSVIIVKDGIYVENINFKGKVLTVKSLNGPEVTTIDGNANGSVVSFVSGEDKYSILDGFTIINGNGTDSFEDGNTYGGGIFCKFSSPQITGCVIANNEVVGANGDGGGLSCYLSSPKITNCTISNNSALGTLGDGGGIHCTYSSPDIVNCIITGNSVGNDGGGLSFHRSSSTLSGCVISNNSARDEGGGIDFWIDATVTITNCVISSNSAVYGGGIRLHWWFTDNHQLYH